MAAYEARQTELAASDPAFTSATPYLTGYAIKVVDDSGEYVASRFHVEGAGTGDNSDLTSFESSLTDNVNAENEKVNEVYAVVAEKIADDADLTGGILSSRVRIWLPEDQLRPGQPHVLHKRAFDAGLTKQLPVLIDGNVWNDVNSGRPHGRGRGAHRGRRRAARALLVRRDRHRLLGAGARPDPRRRRQLRELRTHPRGVRRRSWPRLTRSSWTRARP
ncbi:MAG: hypothetical protein ACLTDR_06050 [Adlercreutzia equolifaciens]